MQLIFVQISWPGPKLQCMCIVKGHDIFCPIPCHVNYMCTCTVLKKKSIRLLVYDVCVGYLTCKSTFVKHNQLGNITSFSYQCTCTCTCKMVPDKWILHTALRCLYMYHSIKLFAGMNLYTFSVYRDTMQGYSTSSGYRQRVRLLFLLCVIHYLHVYVMHLLCVGLLKAIPEGYHQWLRWIF